MKSPDFRSLVVLILFASSMLVVGLYVLAKFNQLFRRTIKNELLRKNAVFWLAAICLLFSVSPTNPDFYSAFLTHKLRYYFLLDCLGATFAALLIFNATKLVTGYLERKKVSFRKKMALILCTIILGAMIMSVPLNYLGNKFFGGKASFNNLQITLLFNFYSGCIAGFIYITMSYVDIDRKRKMNEKELEVSKLQALKTKAELDALHSKINPHFLYNALNSIADLSITDGKKARKMTIALADLFRYSINYSDNNFSTINEELEMTEVYLAIEKIRFEDKLTYSISLAPNVNHYLVPRFVLQPIVENAVKHGLKATGKMTEITIEVACNNDGLEINIGDNGPPFPDELTPGYGVKSIYDKMDLLFPDNYEIHFANHPQKKVSLHIHKLLKNEPVV